MIALFKQFQSAWQRVPQGLSFSLSIGVFVGMGLLSTGAQAQVSGTKGTVTVVPPNQTGFNPQSYTSANLKTVDFDTALLTNTAGISQGTTAASGGGGWNTGTTAITRPTGFANKFARLASGNSGSSQTALTFANGTSYVSFLWHLGTGDSDNTITFKLSDGTSQSISNCPEAVNTCVGGYDTYNFFKSFFSIILGLTGQVDETQSARVVYTPPTGTTVTSLQLSASRSRVCAFWFLCSWESRNLSIDSLSYNDNSAAEPVVTLDHVEVVSTMGSGLTCQNNTFRVRACANAACTVPYTKGVSGSVNFARTGTLAAASTAVNYSIPSGSSTSAELSVSTPSYLGLSTNWTVAATSSPAASAASSCAFGSLSASSNCTFSAKKTNLVLSLPPGTAGSVQTLTTSLVTEGLFGACSPLSGSGTLTSTVTATYGVVGNTVAATLTGSGVGSVVKTLTSGSLVTGLTTGITSALGTNNFVYPDSGPVQLDVTVTGLSGSLTSLLGVKNTVTTLVAPLAFKVEPLIGGAAVLTNPKVVAGQDFQLRITALTALGTVAKNFGLEPGLDLTKVDKLFLKPTGGLVKNNPALALGAIKFVDGVATVTASYDEVGTLDFTASLLQYLTSGLGITGKLTDAVAGGLRLVPAKLELTATPRCTAKDGSSVLNFAYAGQPIDVTVRALNADGLLTQNYDGTAADPANRVANAVNIATAAGAVGGGLVNNVLSATAFANGTGTGTIAYNMTNKLSKPDTVTFAASDADASTATSPPAVLVRSGRIKLSNAFGSEKSTLDMPIQVQYWTGQSWAPSNDSCTTASVLPTAALKRMAYKTHTGATSSSWATAASAVSLVGGVGKLTLSPPNGGNTGTVDVELDLTAAGANMPWLQSLDDACGAGVSCNPKARASFGVYSPESKKTVNVRNVF